MENQKLSDYTVYIYDLPKSEYSSQKLARVFKEISGLDLEEPPTIIKEPQKIFYSGFMKVKCESIEQYNKICEDFRYFKIDGKECRALRFDTNINGKNIPDSIKNG